MQALMLALLLHPEVFAKAQEEIDKLTKESGWSTLTIGTRFPISSVL